MKNTSELVQLRPANAHDPPRLLALWERSARATHHFLTEADVLALRPQVAVELASEAISWWVLTTRADEPMGFLGVVADAIEALFIDPKYFRQGLASRLIGHAQVLSGGALRVDVNEQNPEALRFYQARGFDIVGRSEGDSAGRPFPIVHMLRAAPEAES